MKKVLFGIFAHPDDEAFGPSGTLHLEARSGTDVHLILVTGGDAGKNDRGYEDLRDVRLKEWHTSGKLIGASSMHNLGYNDGELSNNLYLEIAEKIIDYIDSVTEGHSEYIEVNLMTFDQNGLSGHIDHIAVSLISTYVFLNLKQSQKENREIKNLLYFCVHASQIPSANTNWIYMPKGRSDKEITRTVDISEVKSQKLKIMRAHESQKEDMESILKSRAGTSGEDNEHFILYKG